MVPEVFRSGSFRIHEDLYLLSDQYFGWDSNYSILRKAGIEAVRKHPEAYASGVLKTIWLQLSESYFRTPPAKHEPARAPPPGTGGKGTALPAPTEGQPIPAGQSVWISRPDNCIHDVWTSATAHHFTFCRPGMKRRLAAIDRDSTASSLHSEARPQHGARAAAQPGIALVPAIDPLDRARSDRAPLPSPARNAHAARNSTRGSSGDRVERARPLCRSALRASGRSCVRLLRLLRAPRETMKLRWLPALAASCVRRDGGGAGPALVQNNHWDTDASGTLTLAERLRGSGPVYVAHYGEWTTFWGLLGTRALPGTSRSGRRRVTSSPSPLQSCSDGRRRASAGAGQA